MGGGGRPRQRACGVDKFEAYAGLANEAGLHHERPGEIISLDLTIRVKAGYL